MTSSQPHLHPLSTPCPACLSENPPHTLTCSVCGFILETLTQKDLHHLPDHTILINTQHNRRYQINNTLGEGGFGITYKGIDLLHSKTVAIKECWPEKAARQQNSIIWPSSISPENKNQQLKQFLEEGQNIHLCRHPNIVKVYDWFLANNTAYIVMEFIEGLTLYDLIKEKGRLNNLQAKKYLLEIASSLSLIHQKNILHRDIKPDNIIIDQLDRAILIDFGSAREFMANKTNIMTRMISPGYAPLEQYSQQARTGPPLDIYSLCATFYYALTATVPPDATDRINTDNLIPSKQLVSSIDPNIEQVFLTGLKIKAEDRFATADDLIQALQGKWLSPTLKKARKLVKQGDLSQARAFYQNCLNEPDALIELAIIQSHLNDPQLEQTAQKAIQNNPQDSRGYGVLGTFYCHQKQWHQAVTNLQIAESLLPNQSWILANLAWSLSEINQINAAEKALEKVTKISPNQPFILGLQAYIALKKQQWKQTIRYARMALFNAPNDSLKEWVYPYLLFALAKVTQNTATKDLERAIEQWKDTCPQSGLAKAIKGWRLAKNNDWDQALIYFNQANLSQSTNWIILNQAVIQEYLNNLPEAIKLYQQYLQKFPSNYQILYRLGILNAQLGQWNTAKGYLEESLKLKSDFSYAYHNLGWVLLHIKTRDGQIEHFRLLLECYKKALYLYNQEQKLLLVEQIKEAFKRVKIHL